MKEVKGEKNYLCKLPLIMFGMTNHLTNQMGNISLQAWIFVLSKLTLPTQPCYLWIYQIQSHHIFLGYSLKTQPLLSLDNYCSILAQSPIKNRCCLQLACFNALQQ